MCVLYPSTTYVSYVSISLLWIHFLRMNLDPIFLCAPAAWYLARRKRWRALDRQTTYRTQGNLSLFPGIEREFPESPRWTPLAKECASRFLPELRGRWFCELFLTVFSDRSTGRKRSPQPTFLWLFAVGWSQHLDLTSQARLLITLNIKDGTTAVWFPFCSLGLRSYVVVPRCYHINCCEKYPAYCCCSSSCCSSKISHESYK